MMKKITIIGLVLITLILVGCDSILVNDPVDIKVVSNLGNIYDPLEWYLSRNLYEANLTVDIGLDIDIINGIIDVEETHILNVSNATIFNPNGTGNTWIEIWEGDIQYQGEVVGVDATHSSINISPPLKYPFTTAATVYAVDVDQNRDFTDTGIGIQNYSFNPPPGSSDWYITRLIVTMLHQDPSDSSTYGDIYFANGLPNGVYFCGYGTRFPNETGLLFNIKLANCIFNIKTNEDYQNIAFDVEFAEKGANPASPQLYGTSVRKTFSGLEKSNLVIPVRDDRDEFTQATFRDDLSDLSLHRIRVMGYRG